MANLRNVVSVFIRRVRNVLRVTLMIRDDEEYLIIRRRLRTLKVDVIIRRLSVRIEV